MRFISSVNVSGFRGIKNLNLSDLGDLNIFIGASNTGKSSLLEAIFTPLSFQAGHGFESIVQARSDVGLDMVSSLFPGNDLNNTITISLGLTQLEIGANQITIGFTAKKAAALFNEYQTFLSQEGWTDFKKYIVLDISIDQTGIGLQPYQVAFSEIDGSMGARWNMAPPVAQAPVITRTSLFLPRDLVSPKQFEDAFTWVTMSGKESEWIDRLSVLQPGLKNISPVKIGDSWKIYVRLSEFSLPIMAMGDGFKAASMIMAHTLEPALVLIDTPEIFQHPKGLSLISKSIALAISQFGCQVILATQSLEFLDQLMSEVQDTNVDTRIFRFGFDNNQAMAYPPYTLQEAMDARELIGSDLRE